MNYFVVPLLPGTGIVHPNTKHRRRNSVVKDLLGEKHNETGRESY